MVQVDTVHVTFDVHFQTIQKMVKEVNKEPIKTLKPCTKTPCIAYINICHSTTCICYSTTCFLPQYSMYLEQYNMYLPQYNMYLPQYNMYLVENICTRPHINPCHSTTCFYNIAYICYSTTCIRWKTLVHHPTSVEHCLKAACRQLCHMY